MFPNRVSAGPENRVFRVTCLGNIRGRENALVRACCEVQVQGGAEVWYCSNVKANVEHIVTSGKAMGCMLRCVTTRERRLYHRETCLFCFLMQGRLYL